MLLLRVCTDFDECALIWERAWPQESFFDLWQVRVTFANCYKRKPYFVVAEEGSRIVGLLALSWIEETGNFAMFPGETWQGKTWLEQNKIPARSTAVLKELLDFVPGGLHVRYLSSDCLPNGVFPLAVDEVGYLFYPSQYGYSFDNYLQEFSGKSRKKLRREIEVLEQNGVAYRYDNFTDIDWMFRKNIEGFGELSYFSEPRFLASYKSLLGWLSKQKMLRVTTVLLGGEIAAVDIGAVLNGNYTVLAGATSRDFPGVAKIINLHHLEWACGNKLACVDFLCGDFGWKQRFHLTARPLYEVRQAGSAILKNIDRKLGVKNEYRS